MLEKLAGNLIEDIMPLLPVGVTFQGDNAVAGFEKIWRELVVKLESEPRTFTEQVLQSVVSDPPDC